MKILLINPPRWNELVGKNPSIIEEHRGFNPPLGLLYIASSAQKGLPAPSGRCFGYPTPPLDL